MGEAKRRRGQLRVGGQAFLDLLLAYHNAPDDADIEYKLGSTDDGRPHVIVSIGSLVVALTPDECRLMAEISEDTLHHFNGGDGCEDLPNLILGMRMAADKADAEGGKP